MTEPDPNPSAEPAAPPLAHYAILAPVPLEHLDSSLEVVASRGRVAFGTKKWELFGQLDATRKDARVAVLIYPSHYDGEGGPGLTVSWFGWYLGSVHSKGGAHPDGMAFRPTSTAKYLTDNKDHWAAFWHVGGLRRLPQDRHLPIGKIAGLKGGWRKTAPPRGPELVTLPEMLSYEPWPHAPSPA